MLILACPSFETSSELSGWMPLIFLGSGCPISFRRQFSFLLLNVAAEVELASYIFYPPKKLICIKGIALSTCIFIKEKEGIHVCVICSCLVVWYLEFTFSWVGEVSPIWTCRPDILKIDNLWKTQIQKFKTPKQAIIF